jgi:hypothetical protein
MGKLLQEGWIVDQETRVIGPHWTKKSTSLLSKISELATQDSLNSSPKNPILFPVLCRLLPRTSSQ